MDHLTWLLWTQDGVVSRRQVLEAQLGPHDIERKLRRREWARIHEGVYVNHTGPLSWEQRAWAAVLSCWPAALSHASALRAVDGVETPDTRIHVAVHRDRQVAAPRGVVIHRTAAFDERQQRNAAPPRVAYEHALLDVACSTRSDLDAVALLADACGRRHTTPEALVAALAARQRIANRRWLASVLADLAEGTCSVLEHGYLTRVERAHRLPRGRRQASHRHAGSLMFRDVQYDALGLVVELDGRMFHGSVRARDRDMDRDLYAAVDGAETLRLGYGQVFARPCATARAVAAVMTRRGWAGAAQACLLCG